MAAQDKVIAAAEAQGYTLENLHGAQTGTVYMSLWRDDVGAVTVRIADHGEAYLPKRPERRIDVSPEGVSVDTAIAMLADPDRIPCVQARELNADERRAFKEQKAREAAQAAATSVNAAGIRERLIEAGIIHGGGWITTANDKVVPAESANRQMAKQIASQIGERPGRVYKALTGRNF